jgi:hypothetical protein
MVAFLEKESQLMEKHRKHKIWILAPFTWARFMKVGEKEARQKGTTPITVFTLHFITNEIGLRHRNNKTTQHYSKRNEQLTNRMVLYLLIGRNLAFLVHALKQHIHGLEYVKCATMTWGKGRDWARHMVVSHQ